MEIRELPPEKLYHGCDVEVFAFRTTEELEDLEDFIGQPRAVEALHFGIGIGHRGYNIFAMGSPGTGKHTLVRRLLARRAAGEPVPPDICYVNHFETQHKPRLLMLPAGKGKTLAQDMERLLEEMRGALRAAFENEEYQNRRQSVTHEMEERQQEAFEALQRKAREKNLSLLRTPAGLVFAPVRDGEVLPPEEFRKLPDEERQRIEREAEELHQESQKVFQKVPAWERETREKLRELNQEITNFTVKPLFDEVRKQYEAIPEVQDYLTAAEQNIIDSVQLFLQPGGQEQQMPVPQAGGGGGLPGGQGESPMEKALLRRYQVNVIVDHSASEGAPVVYADNPSYQSLVGRVEHVAQMGALLTDFNMIRAGDLHRANGGYLVIDAYQLLMQPYAWEGLKLALKSNRIKVESLGQVFSMISTVSLEPEPVPLACKVVLVGPPMLYHLLRQYDPDFAKLFKVAADFDQEMDRSPANQDAYSRLIATAARKEKLRPFDRHAVGRVIEHSSRMVEDGKKLSAHMQRVIDLLREADYWAGQNGNGHVTRQDVNKAIDAWTFRNDRLREKVQESIQRDIYLIDTDGARVGQVNGLSVLQLGEFAFGRPSRITASIRLGKGEVIDIEREVEMGGPIHSKGVLILGGFLGGRYAREKPLSLAASIVFEQSYSGVEGDSASSAELYALLSAISEVPIKQSFAVTGSVNQHGQVQPIGGVNEKIEGFFDVCRKRGFNGRQGVLIPASNVQHLMLRRDVIEAVADRRFHIYPVETIDQGIEILTGMPAGSPDENGEYPANTINGRVHQRLDDLAARAAAFGAGKSADQRGPK